MDDAKRLHQVRNYDAIGISIDSIRNPIDPGDFCRGAPPGPLTEISLSNGELFTVTQAFINNAQHPGPCRIEIINPDDFNDIVVIGNVENCARNFAENVNTDFKGSVSDSICPDKIPTGLITNDMCMHELKLEVKNVENIKCENCIMRWFWEAGHITPHDFYQTCADVVVNKRQTTFDKSDVVTVTVTPSLPTETPNFPQTSDNPCECKPNFSYTCIDDKHYAICLENNVIFSKCQPSSKCVPNADSIVCQKF